MALRTFFGFESVSEVEEAIVESEEDDDSDEDAEDDALLEDSKEE
jgi:hypothetical protein